jgi:hypothetical protein
MHGMGAISVPAVENNDIGLCPTGYRKALAQKMVFNLVIGIQKNNPLTAMNRKRGISGRIHALIILAYDDKAFIVERAKRRWRAVR